MGYALKENGKQVCDTWGRPIIFDDMASAEHFLAGGDPRVGELPPGCTVKETNRHGNGDQGFASFPSWQAKYADLPNLSLPESKGNQG